MEQVKRWIKFKEIPGWVRSYDVGNVFKLEDSPNRPLIKPSIRLALNGHPASKDGEDVALAGVWLPDVSLLRIVFYCPKRLPEYGYEIRDYSHDAGTTRVSDKLERSYFGDNLNELLWHFIDNLDPKIQHPMKWLREDETGYVKASQAPKPEGYGTWA